LNHFHFPVSFGTILVSWDTQGKLTQIECSENKFAFFHRVMMPSEIASVVDQIRGYFHEGEPIGPVPWDLLDQSEWTPFQKDVYRVIVKIPHGETRTYGWVAEKLGKISASRAVGQALKRNPLPILIPCHRIVAHRSMGGFMGTTDPFQPELQLKLKLLALEERYLSPVFSFLTPDVTVAHSGFLR